MFERFTEQARQVIVLAQDEARALKHNYIGTEHILLGLLREGEGLAAGVLTSAGITLERARESVVGIVGSGEEVTAGQIPFTPRAKKVLELALREALNLDHDYIGTEHLLLALGRDNEGVAARILLDFDLSAERIRRELLPLLPPGSLLPEAIARRPVAVATSRHLGLDWRRATLLWRPEGLELRVPLNLSEGAIAVFAADEVWAQDPLSRMRREIWRGWLALASTTLLDEVDPVDLRRRLDAAAKRAADVNGREQGRIEDFLRRLRDESEQSPQA